MRGFVASALDEPALGVSVGSGFCRCGCGERTRVAPQDYPKRGIRKGEPQQFVKQHQARRRKAFIVNPETGCWIWQGYTIPQGYAMQSIDGESKLVHVLHWERLNGSVPPPGPDGRYELHHLCGDKACVNPGHLELLSRLGHSRKHPRKVTIEMAREIRAATDAPSAQLAERYGIAQVTVEFIRSGRTWREETPDGR